MVSLEEKEMKEVVAKRDLYRLEGKGTKEESSSPRFEPFRRKENKSEEQFIEICII
ncbi:hypothetical protein MUN88_10805 [Gracilibacillus caseinilyticus]|uniref:Uncharacterized protein n=1 Tax=Gracilibacillus caseinilyticus TaxID=2932256 RepID=A0ABY4EQ81_9BACI|nr:hypothetical protein [Gracilibacillus caseinilyticus]UOQ46597.1 hypothetical protein MUN88_10805 [Gracilibacillus caseinilyticus]